VKLHVDRTGTGPDLVLLHGWGLHSGVWSDVVPDLARRFRVHAIDLPGHGYSRDAAVREFGDAAALVASCVPAGAILCGWSMGGLIAQRIASEDSAKVRALVLASSTPCFVERADWPHAMKPATLASFASSLREDYAATLDNFVRLNALNGARSREAVRTFARRVSERGTAPVAALEDGLRWLREVDLRESVKSIAQPTVVIHGARDALAPVEAGRWLARHLPSASYIELPDAAHLPFFTHPREFVQSLESIVA
jgi:pimeloyl-[acyl-carrier protein] methyl ester esterase